MSDLGRTRAATILAAASLGALGACSDGGASAGAFTVRDSAGITILENAVPADGPRVGDGTAPVLHIGVLEGAPEYQFSRIADVTRLPDRRIIVVDGGAGEVRYFSPEGEYLRTVGRPGQGPGEFEYPAGVTVLPGDTLVVMDRMDRVRFGPDGAFIDRERPDLQAFAALWPGGGFSSNAARLPDGSFFAPVYERGSSPPVGPYRPRMALVRVSGDLSRVDTLGVFGGIEQERIDVGGGTVRSIVPPFAVSTTFALDEDRGTVAVGDSRHPQVHLFGLDGSHRIVRWDAPPVPITDAEVEAWKDQQRSSSWTEGQLPQLERGWAQMTVPEAKAFFWRVHPARDGGVWVALGEALDARPEWLVFDPEGRYRGRFSAEGPFHVREIGPDYVLGVYLDATEVEYVRMYRLGG